MVPPYRKVVDVVEEVEASVRCCYVVIVVMLIAAPARYHQIHQAKSMAAGISQMTLETKPITFQGRGIGIGSE